METVVWYDTTLRDGTQQAGLSLSAEDKRKIARRLIDFGIPLVEGGWPSSNPKDEEFFRTAPAALGRERLVAFGATRRAGVRPEADPQVRALLAPEVATVAIVGKASRFQAERVLRVDPDENLRMIEDTVAFARAAGRAVVFDAEHFFDGFADDSGYAVACLEAAARGGAAWLVLCDTNGGALPAAVARASARAAQAGAPLGVHTHNDGGLAVANALAAVEAGARMVQGTVNGYGERCGNADLCQLLPALQLKLGYRVVDDGKLEELVHLARFVAEVANMPLSDSHPYVGVNAFTHKGGLHASGVARDARAYEHIPPERVGAKRRVVLSELAGQASLGAGLGHLGLGREAAAALLGEIKRREHAGYRYEDAEASLEVLARSLGGESAPFELAHYRVVADGPSGRAEATAAVQVGERESHAAAFGNGPVAALDRAVRKALGGLFPSLARVHLVDYKVRVIDGSAGTSALVRVWMESTDGERTWRTVGVSGDVVAASAQALVDALRAALPAPTGATAEPLPGPARSRA